MPDLVSHGHRIALSSLVFCEWRRGPRRRAEIAAQEALLPAEEVVPVGPADAARAAELYRHLSRPHGRELDLAIAPCALGHGAGLWTLNPAISRTCRG